MSKIDKQRSKLQERLKQLEQEMTTALSKKTGGTSDLLPKYMKQIEQVKAQLAALK